MAIAMGSVPAAADLTTRKSPRRGQSPWHGLTLRWGSIHLPCSSLTAMRGNSDPDRRNRSQFVVNKFFTVAFRRVLHTFCLQMWDRLTDESFLKPASALLALVIFLVLLRRINKVLLFVGVAVIGVIYLLNDPPPWLEDIIKSFEY
jgi:hypothetical protein